MIIFIFIFIFSILQPAYPLEDVRFTIADLKNNEEKTPLEIIGINISQDKDKSQIFIELTRPAENIPIIKSTLNTVSFDLEIPMNKKSITEESLLIEEDPNNFITEVKWAEDTNKTTFEIKRKHFSPANFKKLNSGQILVLELPRNYFVKESSTIVPGIDKHFIRTECERGPIIAHALEIDLESENISIKVGMPNKNKIKGKKTLSELISTEMAFAGINANYFDVKAGNPLGTLITDSTWITGPIYDRVAVGFTEDKKILFDKTMLLGNTSVIRGFRKKEVTMLEIDGLNTPFGLYKKVGYFTADFDSNINIPKTKEAFIIENDCIKDIDSGIIEIPKDGYVLLPSDVYHFDKLKRKDCLKINWINNPSSWDDVTEAISGGPYLMRNGEVFIDDKEEKVRFGKKDSYAPRSIIGINDENKLFLISIDGRLNGYSVGATFQDSAQILQKLHIKHAINLDGGGSSTLIADGKIINTLSEHHERKISNGLLIFYK